MANIKIPRWLWYKKYFDTGLGLTSYMKYVIALAGFYSFASDIGTEYVVIAGFLYLFSCIIIGYYWIKYKMVDAENEIGNILNPFQREVRRSITTGRFK